MVNGEWRNEARSTSLLATWLKCRRVLPCSTYDRCQDPRNFIRLWNDGSKQIGSHKPARVNQSKPIVGFPGLIPRNVHLPSKLFAGRCSLRLFHICTNARAGADDLTSQNFAYNSARHCSTQPDNSNSELECALANIRGAVAAVPATACRRHRFRHSPFSIRNSSTIEPPPPLQ